MIDNKSYKNYKRFGVILNRLDIEQKSIVILNELNNMVDDDDRICPILFFAEPFKLVKTPLFARLPLEELYDFSGPVIANNIETATILKNCLCATRRLYYMWDMEWIYDVNFDFNKYAEIYNTFEIITRCQTHYDLFKRVWKKPEYLVEDFYYEQIRDLL